MLKAVALATLIALLPVYSMAETVEVKYRGTVPLDSFICPALKPSSFVKRICYDETEQYLLVRLDQTYYHYCAVEQEVMEEWLNASSLGRFYRANIRNGQFDCRDHPVPVYEVLKPQSADEKFATGFGKDWIVAKTCNAYNAPGYDDDILDGFRETQHLIYEVMTNDGYSAEYIGELIMSGAESLPPTTGGRIGALYRCAEYLPAVMLIATGTRQDTSALEQETYDMIEDLIAEQ